MSEESLRRFLDRLNTDEAFREGMHSDPAGALAEFELSVTERTALGMGDEDALRRLTGADVAGFALPGVLTIGGICPTDQGICIPATDRRICIDLPTQIPADCQRR